MTRNATLHRLDSGLRVVLVPCEAESVAFGLFVASGSRHEPNRFAGASHFIEHMLFKGTPTRSPVDITRAIEGRGGNFNACTGEESTCYYAHLPREYLADAVDVMSDMYLNATFPEEEFAREKEVVIEEIRMYADEPDSVAMENLQAGIFPKSSLGRSVAGSEKTIRPMTAGELLEYRSSHYGASRTVAVIVGSFDQEEALARVKSAFERVGRGVSFRYRPVDAGVAPTAEIKAYKKDIAQAQLAIGFRTFGIRDERKYAASILDGVLGRGMSSRLFQEVREKRGLSYDISSRLQFFEDAGIFSVTAGMDPEKLEETVKIVRRELDRIAKTKVSRRELAEIKEFLVGNFRLSHEKVTSKLFYYGHSALSFGRIINPSKQIAALLSVSAEEVRDVGRGIFSADNMCISTVLPKT